MLILAGDIGGTKCWLRALDSTQPDQILADQVYVSRDFESLEDIIQHFSNTHQFSNYLTACFGLPGPVSGRSAQLTNLPWQVDAEQLQSVCHIERVELINDFQAAAFGIDALQQDQIITLHEGEFDGRGNRLVVGAGTGLGVAPVVRCMDGFWPQPCEGGHMDFAPTDEQQQVILKWLWQAWHHVSYERLLSGNGLQALHAFFAELSATDHQAWLAPAQIHQLAESGDSAAVQALTTFVQIYGGYIGNVALLWPARAGIYIAGGIASKIENWMRKDEFIQRLHDKGRMQNLAKSMPVYLVKDQSLGLKGAMLRARRLAEII
jgi:glucokinase